MKVCAALHEDQMATIRCYRGRGISWWRCSFFRWLPRLPVLRYWQSRDDVHGTCNKAMLFDQVMRIKERSQPKGMKGHFKVLKIYHFHPLIDSLPNQKEFSSSSFDLSAVICFVRQQVHTYHDWYWEQQYLKERQHDFATNGAIPQTILKHKRLPSAPGMVNQHFLPIISLS